MAHASPGIRRRAAERPGHSEWGGWCSDPQARPVRSLGKPPQTIPPGGPRVLDDRSKVRQVERIDSFHAVELGCNASLLREPGVHILPSQRRTRPEWPWCRSWSRQRPAA